ncbi:MAG: discoidin domain-containing protein [Leptodesmis sp.]|uniref:discoidin domain-containing protein n=1 Tax=Leptodesmis sp. TaxID=3100501 RepID=UPI003D13B567
MQIFAAFLLLGTVPLVSNLLAQGDRTLWVAPDGIDSITRGSQSRPLKTLGYACAIAKTGQTIRLSRGDFIERQQCILQSGVTVLGAGVTGGNKTRVFAPANWNFSRDGIKNNPAGYILRVEQGENISIRGLELIGNTHQANGAVMVKDSKAIALSNLKISQFRISGLSFEKSSRIDAQQIYIENSGYEFVPGKEPEFPDGGSLGNIYIRDVSDATFTHISVKTTGLHGYGVKGANLSRVKILHSDFDLYPYQSWKGPSRGNFDIEFHGGYAELVELAHNKFRQTVSLIGGNEARYDRVPYTVHVHHNLFDMKEGAYCVEVGADKLVFDHNRFRNTWTALQNFGNTTTRIKDLTVFNNVVENLTMRFVGLKGRIENLRVFKNTVNLVKGGGQSYLVTLGANNQSENWLLANNVIVGAPENPPASRTFVVVYETKPQSPLRNVEIRNNVYANLSPTIAGDVPAPLPVNWGIQFSNNLQADPRLLARQGFVLAAGSPAIDRGDPALGLSNTWVGASRDVGAFELGEAPWQVGPDSASQISYLWAPTSSIKVPRFADRISVDLAGASGTEIRFTLDGTEPGPNSTLYQKPIQLTDPIKLRARTFANGFGSATTLVLNFAKGTFGYPDLAVNVTYSASSIYAPNLYGPAKAFDGETFSWIGWAPTKEDRRPWLQIDLKQPARIHYVELYTRAQVDSGPDSRRNFQILGSNDPTFYTYTVLARQGSTPLPYQDVFKAEVSAPQRYRYIRATKSEDGWFFITELKIRGER